MADLNDRIGPEDGLVGGDRFDVERTVTDLPAGRTVDKAWMTAKRSESETDSEAAFQKTITTTDDATEGQITDSGSGSGSDRQAVLLFRLQPDETEAVEGNTHVFDVQVKLDNGVVNTPFKGKIKAEADVTAATS